MRWYCPQALHDKQGWIDLYSIAAKQQHEAVWALRQWLDYRIIRGYYRPMTRVLRKPHEWIPQKFKEVLPQKMPGEYFPQRIDVDCIPADPWADKPIKKPAPNQHFLAYYCNPAYCEDPVSICLQDKRGDSYTTKEEYVTCKRCNVILLLT